MNDLVNNPEHYTKNAVILECRDFARLLGFSPGCAFKYVWRYKEKGNPKQDLEKALNYLDDSLAYEHPQDLCYIRMALADILRSKRPDEPALYLILRNDYAAAKKKVEELLNGQIP